MIRKFLINHKIFTLSAILMIVSLLAYLVKSEIEIKNKNYNSALASFIFSSKLQTLCKDCNVILVSLDTLSSNHLPCYGYYRNTSPNLCAFANNNVFFENAYSNATWTLPSHVSMFTGLFPTNDGVIFKGDKLDDKHIMIPQLLKQQGYNTMLFLPWPYDYFSFPTQIYNRLGNSNYNNADYSWEESIKMFKESVRNNKKTFMFLHTYDVHSPYYIGNNPQIYRPINNKFPKTYEEFIKTDWTPEYVNKIISEIQKGVDNNEYFRSYKQDANFWFPQVLNAVPDYNKEVKILKEIDEKVPYLFWEFRNNQNFNRLIDTNNQNDIDSLRALYDQTINNLDAYKIPLLTKLVNDPEFKDNTILIFFADHGEEFMEHGKLFHRTTYNSNIRVPIIMYIPGVNNKKISQNVQLVDIYPTITELLGIKNQPPIDGKSLIRRIFGTDSSNEMIVANGERFNNLSNTKSGIDSSLAVIWGRWKMLTVHNDKNQLNPYELYNLSKDPHEKTDILNENENVKDFLLKKYSNLKSYPSQ